MKKQPSLIDSHRSKTCLDYFKNETFGIEQKLKNLIFNKPKFLSNLKKIEPSQEKKLELVEKEKYLVKDSHQTQAATKRGNPDNSKHSLRNSDLFVNIGKRKLNLGIKRRDFGVESPSPLKSKFSSSKNTRSEKKSKSSKSKKLKRKKTGFPHSFEKNIFNSFNTKGRDELFKRKKKEKRQTVNEKKSNLLGPGYSFKRKKSKSMNELPDSEINGILKPSSFLGVTDNHIIEEEEFRQEGELKKIKTVKFNKNLLVYKYNLKKSFKQDVSEFFWDPIEAGFDV